MGAAAGALGEDNFRDIKKWINASDVMDFFADKLDGGFVWNEGDVDAFCWGDFFALRFGAWAGFFKAAVATTTALAAVIASVALARIALVAVVAAATVVAATWSKIAFLGFAKFLFRVSGFGARPCWTECKLVEKAF